MKYKINYFHYLLDKMIANKARSPLAEKEIEDPVLFEVLKELNIDQLYSKFHNASVNTSILWELDDEALQECGLSKVEKLLYKKAGEINLKKLTNSNQTLMVNSQCCNNVSIPFMNRIYAQKRSQRRNCVD